MRSQLELVSVQLMLASKNTADSNRADDLYPHDELRELWREVLLYQFQ